MSAEIWICCLQICILSPEYLCFKTYSENKKKAFCSWCILYQNDWFYLSSWVSLILSKVSENWIWKVVKRKTFIILFRSMCLAVLIYLRPYSCTKENHHLTCWQVLVYQILGKVKQTVLYNGQIDLISYSLILIKYYLYICFNL